MICWKIMNPPARNPSTRCSKFFHALFLDNQTLTSMLGTLFYELSIKTTSWVSLWQNLGPNVSEHSFKIVQVEGKSKQLCLRPLGF